MGLNGLNGYVLEWVKWVTGVSTYRPVATTHNYFHHKSVVNSLLLYTICIFNLMWSISLASKLFLYIHVSNKPSFEVVITSGGCLSHVVHVCHDRQGQGQTNVVLNCFYCGCVSSRQ